ncbi:hypothetical protein HPB50_005881 [Hyalomma asiaticum]|uniref:Uncharacterized protein n=1 Tax=Hyalomma asiaticum TaxID=266040 RepID=A0ACB7S7S0_HYAAI|nr:hypothetical protein HPB50_005881 [Hyalomma asiaticum]
MARVGVKRTTRARTNARTHRGVGAGGGTAAAIGGHLAERAAQVRRAQVSRREGSHWPRQWDPPRRRPMSAAAPHRWPPLTCATPHLRASPNRKRHPHLPGEHLPASLPRVPVPSLSLLLAWAVSFAFA